MALFSSESKEDKKARKAQELLERYGLQELSDPRDLESVKSIATSLAGNNLITFGATLQGKTEDVAKMFSKSVLEIVFLPCFFSFSICFIMLIPPLVHS